MLLNVYEIESNDNENVDQDLENVEDLLADVNTEDVDELSGWLFVYD